MTGSASALAYLAPSTLAQPRDLRLSTRATQDAHQQLFFDGFVTPGEQTAQALLLIAKIARTRFYTPPGMLARVLREADPVVTSNADRLRFESFSACCGVAARLDILADGLDPAPLRTGTTNVDVNPPLRAALADVRGLDPLHVAVGTDVTVTTMTTSVTEPQVPLPDRWIRGFAESQAVASNLTPKANLTVGAARSFILIVPASSGSQSVLYAQPTGSGLRLTTRASRDAIPLGGPSRLRVLEPLLRFANRLTVYAPEECGAPAASLWQLDLVHARFVMMVSPMAMRGFSGEGGLLNELANAQAAQDAELISARLAHEPTINIPSLAHVCGIAATRVRLALPHIAASGLIGWDAADGDWFYRELPWRAARAERDNPRLAGARQLVAAGAVRLERTRAVVSGSTGKHIVRTTAQGRTCSCPWYAQFAATRGPCKHVLAVQLLLTDAHEAPQVDAAERALPDRNGPDTG